jgi:hypothetical protein
MDDFLNHAPREHKSIDLLLGQNPEFRPPPQEYKSIDLSGLVPYGQSGMAPANQSWRASRLSEYGAAPVGTPDQQQMAQRQQMAKAAALDAQVGGSLDFSQTPANEMIYASACTRS